MIKIFKNNIILLATVSAVLLIGGLTTVLSIIYANTNFPIQKPPSQLLLKIDGEIVKNYDDFTISFNRTIRLPNYAFYTLQEEREKKCSKKVWTEDKGLNTYKIDILKGLKGWQRGHLVPSVDVDNTCTTYTMANMVPMIGNNFNNAIWKTLENYIRKTYYNFEILTVPDYNLSNIINEASEQIIYPSGLYKIIMSNNKIICSIYLKHQSYAKGSQLKDHAICDRLPYMINAPIIGNCDNYKNMPVCRNVQQKTN